MEPEIITWFYDRGFNVGKLIDNAAPGVRPTQVKAAMVQLYKNYDGKIIGLGHKVQELAQNIKDVEMIEQELDLARSHETAKFYRQKYKTIKFWFIGSIGLWLWFASLLYKHYWYY